MEYLISQSDEIRRKYYGNKVYIRGLIEFSNYCKNDCFYCGIRKSNLNVSRYRLSKEDILECCNHGYELGFRTFVLQSGEDRFFSTEVMTDIISSIKNSFPDCAITISSGENTYEHYLALFNAGANRYLLRHETANAAHYSQLHPPSMSWKNRINCLNNLKKIGFQTGTGFMVGSPFQTMDTIAEDLLFIYNFQPQMVGIGPFIPHHDTIFADMPHGSVNLTIALLAMIRLIIPNILLPATTALGTIAAKAREAGIFAGANVIMPNLSPINVRKKYLIYDNKIATGEETAESLSKLRESLDKIGFEIVVAKGDIIPIF